MKKIVKLFTVLSLFIGFAFVSANEYITSSYTTIDNKISFKADYQDGVVYTAWSKFDIYSLGENFKYYKVIRSQKNNNPVYPEDGYISYDSDRSSLEYTDKSPLYGTSYYRVCAITDLNNRYCSNVVKIDVPYTKPAEPVACTMEVKLCSDGETYVGRTGPNCEFSACPSEKPVACTKEYAPVCGMIKTNNCSSGSDCAEPDTLSKTYSNKCMMQASGAVYMYSGECRDSTKPYFYLSDSLKKKINALTLDFINKVEEKYSDTEKRISVFKIVLDRLQNLLKEKPRYENIVKYMTYLLEEKIKSYYDDLSDFESIFSDY